MPSRVRIGDLLGELDRQGACRLDESFPLELTRELEIPGPEIERVIKFVKQFSELSKFRILLLLYYNGSLPVCIISSILRLEQTLVSHHLKKLKSVGLVEYERRGKYKLYKLSKCAVNLVKALLETLVEQQPRCERPIENTERKQEMEINGDFQ